MEKIPNKKKKIKKKKKLKEKKKDVPFSSNTHPPKTQQNQTKQSSGTKRCKPKKENKIKKNGLPDSMSQLKIQKRPFGSKGADGFTDLYVSFPGVLLIKGSRVVLSTHFFVFDFVGRFAPEEREEKREGKRREKREEKRSFYFSFFSVLLITYQDAGFFFFFFFFFFFSPFPLSTTHPLTPPQQGERRRKRKMGEGGSETGAEKTLFEGYLRKQRNNGKGWDMRWFVLRDSSLDYFERPGVCCFLVFGF